MRQALLGWERRLFISPLEAALGLFLARDDAGAKIRLAFIALTFGTYWIFLALTSDFPRVLPETWLARLPFPTDIFVDLATSFFAPRILLHVIPVLAGLWLAFRIGAHYLSDLFELESISISARYLSAALFGLNYPKLSINQGDLQGLDHRNPILRIGGPGYLITHLGYAAIFETVDARPQIYGPSGRRFIRGFERLRDVVDLRDQHLQVHEVRAITRDGIEIFARDAQMVFRVFGGDAARSLKQPYPYTEDGLRGFVYGRAISGEGRGKWVSALYGLVSREIRNFVEALTIEEFLALHPDVVPQSDSERADQHPPRPSPDSFHIPRRVLTERFHTEETRLRLESAGLELSWVGVGTWEVRDPTSGRGAPTGVGETIITAWRDLQRAKRHRTPEYLKQQQVRRAREFVGRLLSEVIETWEHGPFKDRHRCWAVLKQIQKFLLENRGDLIATPESDLALAFRLCLEHIQNLTESKELGGS